MLEAITKWHRRLKITDKLALGPLLHPKDAEQDYLQENRTYAWHVAIGRALRPTRIGEIGVRFGYGLACLAGGSIGDRPEPPAMSLWGWDSECYEPESMKLARQHLERFGGDLELRKANTRDLTDLGCPPLHLIHVDGDHSTTGALHDMALAWRALDARGVMLVDDYYFIPDVQKAVAGFSLAQGIGYEVLPTFRGTALFAKELTSA